MPNYSLSLAPGAFALTGRPVGRRIARRLRLSPGAFVLTGQTVDINHETADAIGYPAVLDVHGGFGSSRTSHSFQTIAGALLLGESLGWVQWLGCGLMLAGIVVSQVVDPPKPADESAAPAG